MLMAVTDIAEPRFVSTMRDASIIRAARASLYTARSLPVAESWHRHQGARQ